MKIMQANLARFMSHDKLHDDLTNQILPNCGIAGLNEVAVPNDIRFIHNILDDVGWHYSFTEVNPCGNGVIWNPKFWEGLNTTEDVVVLPGMPDRSIVTQKLRHKITNKTLNVLSTHLTAKAFTAHPERRDEWRKAMATVAVIFKDSRTDATVLTGDLNCNYLRLRTRRYVTRPMPDYASYDMKKEPTFGQALYDYVVHKGPLLVTNRYTFRGNSDHKFPRVTYRWK